MAEDRIPVTYLFDPVKKEIHRKKGTKDELIEDKIVALYDPETRVVTFKNALDLRNYKVGVITFLGENEMPIREFRRGDLKADKPLTKDVPVRPKKDPNQGDKTPTVVEWYFRHRFSEFQARYGVQGKFSGKVSYLRPIWEKRPLDNQLEFRGQERVEEEVTDVLVADRAVAGVNGKRITFTPDECVGYSEDEEQTGLEHSDALMAGQGED